MQMSVFSFAKKKKTFLCWWCWNYVYSRSSSTSSSAKKNGEISNKINVAQEQECESVVDAPTAPSSSSTSPSTKEVSSDDVLVAEDSGAGVDVMKKRQARPKAKNDHTKYLFQKRKTPFTKSIHKISLIKSFFPECCFPIFHVQCLRVCVC